MSVIVADLTFVQPASGATPAYRMQVALRHVEQAGGVPSQVNIGKPMEDTPDGPLEPVTVRALFNLACLNEEEADNQLEALFRDRGTPAHCLTSYSQSHFDQPETHFPAGSGPLAGAVEL